ncbi:hypothetical protein [Amycolatopsis sp. GM8]|uniref:hypothetical protein n=1 Tax=Amycolatopsis sp. GM8 TaxID=2896530 RepID=UPI001F265695|nr:hypothetical protein [Amycolatopsis sp. GM8]
MTEKRLGHKQTAVVFTLMALAREVSNPELQAIVGFTLDGQDRRRLNELDLVASHKQGRSFAHELTERGWAWCEGELGQETPPSPRPRSVLSVALYVLLSGVDQYRRREGLRLADIFAPTSDVTAEETPEDIESRIRTAYRKLARSPRDWVGLAELRTELGGAPAQDVDAVLKELNRAGQVHLVPESNRKTLTPADREAAIRVGGEDNHLLSIEVS